VSAVDGWGRAGSDRGEGSAGARELGHLGREGGGEKSAGAREREIGSLGRKRPSRGGIFPFSFSIYFISFSFEQIIS
jgi:hypothetical protein